MTIELRYSGPGRSGPRQAGKLSVSSPELLYAAVAAIEGLAAFAIFLCAALVYHLLVLQAGLSDTPIRLFVALGVVIGTVYSGLSFSHFNRILSGGARLSSALTLGLNAWCTAYGFALLLAYSVGVAGGLSRVSIISAFVLGAPLAIALRALLIGTLHKRVAGGRLHFEQIAVIGHREHVVSYLYRSNLWRHGRHISAVLYFEDIAEDGGDVPSQKVGQFAAEAVAAGVESIVFVTDRDDTGPVQPHVDALRRFSVNVDLVSIGLSGFRILELVRVGDGARLRIARKPIARPMLVLKRITDTVGAAIGLMLLSPLLVLVALAIKIESPGPVFFRQERRGFNGRTFMIWKFRSMRTLESGYRMAQAEREDPRVTAVGRLIRRTSIDELPQLLNVLRGEMSLVGPRPHAVSHDDQLVEQLADYAFRNRIKPGLTGWAQVQGYRGETRTPEQIRARVSCDLHYIENWTIFLDVWIILLTIFSRRTHRGVF